MVDRNKDQIANFNECLNYDGETIWKKLKDANIVFVQNEGEKLLEKFRYFCSEIAGNNQDGEIFHKYESSEIPEHARELANFFLTGNVDCLEIGKYESLQLLETKFDYFMMVHCTKPSFNIPNLLND